MFEVDHEIFKPLLGDKEEPKAQTLIIGDALDNAMSSYGEMASRNNAMCVALQWYEEPERDFETIEGLIENACIPIFDDSEDDEIDVPDEQFNAMAELVCDALVQLGGKPECVASFMNTEDEEAAFSLGDQIEFVMDEALETDDDIINRFAVGGIVFDDAKKKAVRGGEVVFVPKKRKKNRRRTAKQKSAFKAARKKSNNAQAKVARKKSNKIRKNRGMS